MGIFHYDVVFKKGSLELVDRFSRDPLRGLTAVAIMPTLGRISHSEGGPVMATIAREKAVGMLKQAIEQFQADDLREVYNELFPEKPISEEETGRDAPQVEKRVLQHMNNGLEIQEILDLWRVVFPRDRNVFYDDDTATIHTNEESNPLQYAD
jgi:hypothetical protein